jgi:hypothetical protein
MPPFQRIIKKIVTNSNMSQSVKEFVRQSGVQVQTQNSNSNSNDEFARDLEQDMLRRQRERAAGFRSPPRPMRPVPRQVQVPQRLQRDLVNDRSYAGAFKQFENSNNNSPLENEFDDVKLSANEEKMIDNLVQEFDVPPPTALQFSKFNPGMFNATVDSGFGQKATVLDLKKILVNKPPLPKTPIGEGLYVETHEIKGIYGQFQTGFSHTRNAGPKGSLNKNFASVQFMITLSNDTESKGGTVNIYRNGKIRFSGGFIGTNIVNQPELLRRFIVTTYTERQEFLYNPFTYNNLSGKFRINGLFNSLPVIASRQRMYGMTTMSIIEEQTPFLYVPIEGATLIFSKSGNIQIVGAKTPASMLKGYDTAKDLIIKLYEDGQVTVTGFFDKGVKVGRSKSKPKKNSVSPKRKYIKRNSDENQRMSKIELVALARRKGVVNFRVKNINGSRLATKDEIRNRIKNLSNKKNVTFKNTQKNENVRLNGNGNAFRVGRKICTDMKKDELIRIAGILKIKPGEKETKKTLCKKIQVVRNDLAKPKPSKRQVQRTVANAKLNVKKGEVMKKRGLDENSIRKDLRKLYGDKWMKRYQPNLNQDVRNMKSALNAINKGNKAGVPFKKNIDQVKKNVVSRWKMERRRELERNYLMNKVNTTGIALNLKNDYRRAASNYIMSKKTPPSNKTMMEYRNYWLKFRANVNSNRRSIGINRVVKARVEKM